jgi:hypothetical protein
VIEHIPAIIAAIIVAVGASTTLSACRPYR